MNTYIKVVVFDLHDVLFTRNYWNTFKLLHSIQNKSMLIQLLLNPKFVYDAFKMLSVTKVSEAYIIKLSQKHHKFTHYIDALIDITNALKPISEMFLLIQSLKAKGLKIYVFSNIGQKTYTKLLQSHDDFFSQFDGIHFVQENNNWLAKPHHDAYHLFLEKFSIKPQEMVFIDDKPKNVIAAHQLGITAIQYKSSKQVCAQLSKLNVLT